MKHEHVQNDNAFTTSGAILGFVAYLLIALLIAWVFV